MTLAEENYIKAVYHLESKYENGVPTNALADKMKTKASSVTDMVKKLAEKGLLVYKPYQGAFLSEKGRSHAIMVIRRHRLWEQFLVEKLNFNWDEVHDLAEQLEHIESDKLINELDAFLDFPTHDPHGDPIPDRHGQIQRTDKIMLSQGVCNIGYQCVGVNDSTPNFLKYLDKNCIGIGTKILVKDIEEFDQSMTIKINDKTLVMSKAITSNIYVKKI
ncbi:metal-dependent transcriptional regulator [Winogradskyella sp.]|uniref:metal-dependent transcriptional regulator n=1 Tax=Winogradskyella sp. TaxID=1883156 RepID=UPI0026211E2A|nr:metal-dependent transcriptional regulator [Winogradskyella sp.]